MASRARGGIQPPDPEAEDVKVVLSLCTTVTPSTISLASLNSSTKSSGKVITASTSSLPLQEAVTVPTGTLDIAINIHVSIKQNSRNPHPDLPVTLSTFMTPLQRDSNPYDEAADSNKKSDHDGIPESIKKDENSLDSSRPFSQVWINRLLEPFSGSHQNRNRYAAPREYSLRVCRRDGTPRDLRRAWDFITIPPTPSTIQANDATTITKTDRQKITISHTIPFSALQFWEIAPDGQRIDSIQPEAGEKFTIKPSNSALKTFWWRWGDLEADLKDKKFRANDEWFDQDAEDGLDHNLQDADEDEHGEWVASEGDNGSGLVMEVTQLGEITFVP